MKILQITSDYHNTAVYSNLFTELGKRIDLKVIVPLTSDKKQNYVNKINPKHSTSIFIGEAQIFGIQINSSKFAKHIVANGIYDGIDLIHAHYVLNDGSIALKLYKQLGIPYMVSVRASCIMNFDRKIALHNYVNGLHVLRNAKAVFFQTSNALDILLQKIPKLYRNEILKKFIIIPNGIDKFWHENTILQKTNFNEKAFSVITVASIEYNKNLLLVAKAVENLNKYGYNIKYKIAGTVINESILNELLQNEHIHYLGSLSKDELLNAYRQSDIFIMVSHNETFGLVYAEAMSQGLPTIYTKGEGFDGQFQEGTVGFHASSNSLVEIEEAILKVINDYEKLSTNAVRNVSKFDWKKIADKYCAIYSEVIKTTNLNKNN